MTSVVWKHQCPSCDKPGPTSRHCTDCRTPESLTQNLEDPTQAKFNEWLATIPLPPPGRRIQIEYDTKFDPEAMRSNEIRVETTATYHYKDNDDD